MPPAVWTTLFWPYSLEPVKSNKASQKLLADDAAATGKGLPNGHVYKGYHAMQCLLEGICKAGTTDTEGLIGAM